MIESSATQPRTPDEWQYWGAFLDTLLNQRIVKTGRGYYAPFLYTESTLQKTMNFIEANSDLKPLSKKDPAEKNPTHNPIFRRGVSAVDKSLSFIEPLQPHLLTQADLAGRMIDFLYFKSRHLYKHLSSEEREEQEELVERFDEERKKPTSFNGNLTAPVVAGLIDATNSITIRRTEKRLIYTPVVLIYAGAERLAYAIYEKYGGSYYPTEEGTAKKGAAYGYEWIGTGEAVERILKDSQQNIVLCKRQADLALQFRHLQEYLAKGHNPIRPQRGDLARVLTEYSGQFNLVDLLREGFYSQMRRLNNQ